MDCFNLAFINSCVIFDYERNLSNFIFNIEISSVRPVQIALFVNLSMLKPSEIIPIAV